jgi:hypothetical protein
MNVPNGATFTEALRLATTDLTAMYKLSQTGPHEVKIGRRRYSQATATSEGSSQFLIVARWSDDAGFLRSWAEGIAAQEASNPPGPTTTLTSEGAVIGFRGDCTTQEAWAVGYVLKGAAALVVRIKQPNAVDGHTGERTSELEKQLTGILGSLSTKKLGPPLGSPK